MTGTETQTIESLAKLRGQWEALQASGLSVDEIRSTMTEILDTLRERGADAANAILAARTTDEGREAGSRWVADFMRAAA